jgi:nucleotide-binding universal stress UspA family protein
MSATTAMFTLAGIWIGIGLLLALVMGRHGHDPFAWWLLGTLLGPLALPLALSAERRQAERAQQLRIGVPGRGPVDVLVGLDGSPEAGAALLTVLDLLGPQLGRLTLATVIDLDASAEHDRAKDQARAELLRRADQIRMRLWSPSQDPDEHGRPLPDLILLPGQPAEALQPLAAEGAYDLVVVGVRGSGLSKVLLGSTATTLAAQAKVPVLLAGG